MPTRTPPRTWRVVIVDDHPMMRLGLRHFLGQTGEFEVAGEAADALSALQTIQAHQPQAAIIDISLGGRSGLDLIKDIRARFPRIAILVHSMHDEAVFAERALRVGAHGYVMKQESGAELLRALRTVLRGHTYLSESLRRASGGERARRGADRRTPVSRLSDREFEVFCLIGEGCPNREIAARLHISPKTVDVHRDHLKRKLGLDTATALNLFAVRWVAAETAE